MVSSALKKGHPAWIGVVFFFVGFCPGVWMPSLPSLLRLQGHAEWIPWIYIGMPIGSILSPFIIGALSDGKIAANQLCGIVMLAGGVTMTLAFGCLHAGVSPEFFVGLMFLNALTSAPLWALVTQSALAFLTGREDRFPFYRVFGTVGWLSAGLVGGLLLGADHSALGGLVGGILRFPVGLLCFLMPHCPPLGKGSRFSILQMLGEGSRELWADRNTRVLFISAALLAIPLSAFFMYTPLQLQELGIAEPMAWMSLSQWCEIPAMLTLAWACKRYRIKWLVSFGLGVSAVRQILFMIGAQNDSVSIILFGLLTHGLTFAYFLTVAQVHMEKRVQPALRGRAQGMLSLMFGGVGSLIGVIVMSNLFDHTVDLEAGTGWTTYWGILGILATIPAVYFMLSYRIMSREPVKSLVGK